MRVIPTTYLSGMNLQVATLPEANKKSPLENRIITAVWKFIIKKNSIDFQARFLMLESGKGIF